MDTWLRDLVKEFGFVKPQKKSATQIEHTQRVHVGICIYLGPKAVPIYLL